MGSIKERRLRLPVNCHPGTCVGDYVPFYYCPRSVMLYLIHKANHPELTYRGGQDPIVHLEADLNNAVDWANGQGKHWTFSLSNAAAGYTQFRANLNELDQINWNSIAARDWRASEVREGKQAEFLMQEAFPWELMTRIGVISRQYYDQVRAALRNAAHRPTIEIKPDWYY